jgi:hypothetical protein
MKSMNLNCLWVLDTCVMNAESVLGFFVSVWRVLGNF